MRYNDEEKKIIIEWYMLHAGSGCKCTAVLGADCLLVDKITMSRFSDCECPCHHPWSLNIDGTLRRIQ